MGKHLLVWVGPYTARSATNIMESRPCRTCSRIDSTVSMIFQPKERPIDATFDYITPKAKPAGLSTAAAPFPDRSLWCVTDKAEIRQLSPDIGELRLKPYVDVEKEDAALILQTIREMGASCVLVDHRAPHSVNFQAQLAFFHQRTMTTIGIWVDMRAPSVAAASHLASMIRPTCSARLFYTRKQAAFWLHEQCEA